MPLKPNDEDDCILILQFLLQTFHATILITRETCKKFWQEKEIILLKQEEHMLLHQGACHCDSKNTESCIIIIIIFFFRLRSIKIAMHLD